MSTTPKQKPVRRGEARERLLLAARELIVAHGLDGVSIRAVNAAAGVSPGILHYHFGSLDELVLELLQRNMKPLMEERREQFAECRARGATVCDIAEVLVLPLARFAIKGGEEGAAHVRLLARLYGDRSPLLERAERPWANDFYRELLAVVQEWRPDVPERQLAQRFDLATHAFLRGLASLQQPPFPWQAQRGMAGLDPWEQVQTIVDFVAAGLTASGPRAAG